MPHVPQLETLLERSVSQPLASEPSQSPQPPLHEAITQLPVAQLAVACARLQAVPQEPQLASVVRLVSQPFPTLLSQLPQPVLHEIEQTLAVQLGVPFAELQALPQAPQ